MAEATQDLIVVDASIVFKWFVVEEDSDKAAAMLGVWETKRSHLAAPHFMVAEVANAFHQRVRQGHMTVREAEARVESVLSPSLAIELYDSSSLHRRALELASLLRQPAVYDCIYLALAETLNGELWTADRTFFRAARSEFSNVRWLSEANAPS